MAVDSDFQAFIVDQLSTIPLVPRRMFGGVGFFVDGLMFGLIGRSDTLFFKTDESNVAEYEALGGEPFTYSRGEKKSSMGYHTVPAEILDDGEELTAWAEKAIAVARHAAASKPKPRGRKKTATKAKRPKRNTSAKK